MPKRAWQKLSADAGAKGHRVYDWALAGVADGQAGLRRLLVRRNRNSGELAFCRSSSATPAWLTTLVRVAGRRWTIKETFQADKDWPD
ncbi:hypothetical protein [Streptomyces sp. 049-1]|uniref:hypothetical protein n=1 Tax=Streptomyces sp. 049-1 TaxID=2789264 RepID=UPI0039814723